MASKKGHLDCVVALLRNGADINLYTNRICTIIIIIHLFTLLLYTITHYW